ncbi:MAG: iron ABC transporter permease [Acidimicrobiia bacterium]|nr:iron ABC transporter permease [Acidimicrobiia bacterium]NNF69053.1 iron ABC transporter permease [Acidimicrobiia bacterium]
MQAVERRPSGRLRLRPLTLAVGALLLAATAAVALGPVSLPFSDVMRELLSRLPGISIESGLSEREAAILWELRVPRVALAGLVGALLSGAGAAYQGSFRNPLADPYLLGVAAGAGLGATLVISGGITNPAALTAAAFVGGVVAVVITYAAGRIGGGSSAVTLILAGVAVASFFTAVQTFVQQLSSDTVREVFSWILGRLTTVGWAEVWLVTPFAVVTAAVLLMHRRHLDVLAVGDAEASSLGMAAGRVRLIIVLAATLGTAAAVSVSGLIGFVGIVVPHTVRLMTGTSYRTIIPMSLVAGGAFLIGADLLARTVIAPSELPIGVITAFVGAPFFAVILRARRAG